MRKIQMADLSLQHDNIRPQIDKAISQIINDSTFIKGPAVYGLENDLEAYLEVNHAITCGNGSDALLAALLSLDLQPEDEIIIPSFSFIAPAEAAKLAGLKPVFADVHEDNFNISIDSAEKLVNDKTKAIVVVHLFGQPAEMDKALAFAKKHNLYIIEDFAQAFGAEYILNGEIKKAGTLGDIGCTSFFPSKNLGCMGDGGAVVTNNETIATKLRHIVNHGGARKYEHIRVGFNSRLDTIQAAVLRLKLKLVDDYVEKRQLASSVYDNYLGKKEYISIPKRTKNASHSFNQYTIKVSAEKRDALKEHLLDNGIPSMVYYPKSLHEQSVFGEKTDIAPISERLSQQCLSIPIYPELDDEQQEFIIKTIIAFFE